MHIHTTVFEEEDGEEEGGVFAVKRYFEEREEWGDLYILKREGAQGLLPSVICRLPSRQVSPMTAPSAGSELDTWNATVDCY